jgi:creatinine amidohydrolase
MIISQYNSTMCFALRLLLVCVLAIPVFSQKLPVRWEELTAGDFVKAIGQSRGVCALPFGIVEKHGPHLPLGTDLFNVRYATLRAAAEEYVVVFPEYYFGQIFEARHEPGTVAYSARLQLDLLQETADEMARNGCKKIVILNGHGGNNSLLPYFAQTQMAAARDYVVYVYNRQAYTAGRPPMVSKSDGHAGESETSHTMVSRPELVHLERAATESGADRKRLDLPTGLYTGIWWYSKFPDHYAGDAAGANTALGEFDMKAWAAGIAGVFRAVKTDQASLRLQQEFYENSRTPLRTKQ